MSNAEEKIKEVLSSWREKIDQLTIERNLLTEKLGDLLDNNADIASWSAKVNEINAQIRSYQALVSFVANEKPVIKTIPHLRWASFIAIHKHPDVRSAEAKEFQKTTRELMKNYVDTHSKE